MTIAHWLMVGCGIAFVALVVSGCFDRFIGGL